MDTNIDVDTETGTVKNSDRSTGRDRDTENISRDTDEDVNTDIMWRCDNLRPAPCFFVTDNSILQQSFVDDLFLAKYTMRSSMPSSLIMVFHVNYQANCWQSQHLYLKKIRSCYNLIWPRIIWARHLLSTDDGIRLRKFNRLLLTLYFYRA